MNLLAPELKILFELKGDSGSGLQYSADEVFYLYGVTSFGVGCGSSIPAVYTRVSEYISWIEDIVWP